MSEIKHAGLGTVVLLAVLAIAYQAFDRSRCYSAKGSREVLAEAPDRYFLYLRSFVDDELSIEGPVYSVQTMLQKRDSNRCKIGSPGFEPATHGLTVRGALRLAERGGSGLHSAAQGARFPLGPPYPWD